MIIKRFEYFFDLLECDVKYENLTDRKFKPNLVPLHIYRVLNSTLHRLDAGEIDSFAQYHCASHTH